MPDDLLCNALARGIAVRLPLASEGELRAVDVVLQTLEAIRHGDGRDWLRRLATGPGDVDRDYHLARRLRATYATACGGSWELDDAVDLSPNPPLVERCHACWRAAAASSPGGPALGEALLVVVAEMEERDQERHELREAARAEMLGPVCSTCGDTHRMTLGDREVMCTRCPTPCEACRVRHRGSGAGAYCSATPCSCGCHARPEPVIAEFSPDRHLTRLDSTSAVIALAEVPRRRDEELEVDIWDEWDVSDVAGGA